MAQSRKTKQAPKYPKGILFTHNDGEYRLFKIWGKNATAGDPFYITGDLGEMLDEMTAKTKIWNCKIDLKKLNKFIQEHDQKDDQPQADTPRSYLYS